MTDAAVMLRGEARRTASILHQTPGWRWRRDLCLTERSQQCQSGPTTKAWRRLPARQRWTHARHRPGHVRGALPKLHGNGRRVRVTPPGACGLHRRKEIHAGVDSIVSKDMRAAPLGSTQVAASKRVRVAPPDSIVRASAGSTARNTWNECG